VTGKDRYGRTIGGVLLSDGTNVNHELVKDGWCCWHQKYAPGDTVLEGLETDTLEAKKGLWADPQPVPPWEWRKKEVAVESSKTSIFCCTLLTLPMS